MKTSYLWLFFVPTVAGWLEPLSVVHAFTFFGVTFTVELPFSWRCLWVMSVFFVVAQLLYAGCCPALVKDFGDYGEYRAAYAGPEHLTATLIKMVSSASRGEILRCADEYFSIPGQQRESQPETEYPLEALRDLLVRNFRDLMYCGCLRGSPAYGMEDLRVVDEERLSNELERALRMSGRLHRTTFWLSAACFATGVSLFLWVARETVVNGVPLILNT